RVKRRDFITLLGGVATASPLVARAQPGKLPTIGYLGTAAASAWAPWTAAFVQRLHELGWIDGRTVVIHYRSAEGRTERSVELAAELARLKVDVIVTGGNAALAAKQASWWCRSCSRWWTTRSAWAWLQVWRDLAATSPACRSSRPSWRENGSSS